LNLEFRIQHFRTESERRGKYRNKLINEDTELIDACVPLLKIRAPANYKLEISVCPNEGLHEGTRSRFYVIVKHGLDQGWPTIFAQGQIKKNRRLLRAFSSLIFKFKGKFIPADRRFTWIRAKYKKRCKRNYRVPKHNFRMKNLGFVFVLRSSMKLWKNWRAF
jgi:hypothetical protein